MTSDIFLAIFIFMNLLIPILYLFHLHIKLKFNIYTFQILLNKVFAKETTYIPSMIYHMILGLRNRWTGILTRLFINPIIITIISYDFLCSQGSMFFVLFSGARDLELVDTVLLIIFLWLLI